MKSRKGTQTTDAKEAGRSENAIILILDLTLSDFSRPQLYAIWSVSIFPERLSRKCVGLNPKRRRMPIRLQKRDVDPGFTTHYLCNSTPQVMVGRTFVKYSITGVKRFRHIFSQIYPVSRSLITLNIAPKQSTSWHGRLLFFFLPKCAV